MANSVENDNTAAASKPFFARKCAKDFVRFSNYVVLNLVNLVRIAKMKNRKNDYPSLINIR